ncbi:MAG TPA: isoprenylcysteine carboxylmethyltransferase family protein [Caulobacteraceae bacterium]|jgi:protein-S-isoprenylcysteine O-methyltransferase Ste14
MNKLEAKAWTWLVAASAIMGFVLFLSAGTVQYWQAWVYLVVIVVCSVPVTLYMIKDPVLLESRTKFGPAAEQRPIQRLIVLVLFLPTIAVFIVPGLDHRFGWSNMPTWLCIVGDLLIAVSIWISYRVFKENAFGSSTIEVVKDQKVISTGPYALVRNPMYSSAVLFFIAMSLALGSYWGLIPAALTIPCFAWRLSDEEKFLAENLPGYTEYCAKVRWRLIPGVF